MSPSPNLLFPPRLVERAPGRFRADSPVVRAVGPASILQPAADALRSAGLELVLDSGAESSARLGVPSRPLLDRATASWFKLYADAGPERYDQAFRIVADVSGVRLGAGGPAGLLYGLLHLAEAWDDGLDCGTVADWPEVERRCVLLDVSRCRVPRLSFLERFIDLIATLRYNQLTFNLEHVLMPVDGDPAEAEALTPDEIAAVDRLCRDRGIEYIPFQQSFGHLRGILRRPEHRGLAYDPGKLWSVNPGNEKTYQLLGELYDRQMAVTTSPLFHAGCDEPFDLHRNFSPARFGGRSREEVIVDHIARVARMIAERGRRPMVWADALPADDKLLARLPDDLVLCHWHYGTGALEGVDHYRQKLTCPNRPFYACASTWSFVKPFPDLAVMRASNDGLYTAAKERGPMGLMTTIWGDMGHTNLPGLEVYPLAYAARHGWCPAPETVPPEKLREDYLRSFAPDDAYALPLSRLVHGGRSPELDRLPLLLDGLNRAFTGPVGMGSVGMLEFFAEPFALPLLPPDFQQDPLFRMLSTAALDGQAALAGAEKDGVRGREFLLDCHLPVMMAEYLALKVGIIHALRAVPPSAQHLRRSAAECTRAVQLLVRALALLESRWLAHHKRSGFEANLVRWRRLIQAWRDRERELAGYADDLAAGRPVPDMARILATPPAGYAFDLLAETGLKNLIS